MWWAKRDLTAARVWMWMARVCLSRELERRRACDRNLSECRAISMRRCLGERP
jgi:hypothetical protein